MRIERSRVCDVCGSDVSVTRWRCGKAGGRVASPDLCGKHSKPFEEIMKLLPHGKRGQAATPEVLTDAQVRARVKKFRAQQARKTS